MSIKKRVHEILGISQNPPALIQLHPDLFTAVAQIAVENGRTIHDVANELIHNALHDHRLATNSLRIWQQLTQREREITALIWLGLTNPQIAQRLSISPNTVKSHIKNILNKFNVHSKKSLTTLLSGLDLSDWIGDDQPQTDSSPNGVNP
ncbi:MAG: helix-turn-helix transcriptional regulator [Anaerolineales bacterium]|nr:helix-turn-helix transcriptional regulator [Anaerolineales bacterium]